MVTALDGTISTDDERNRRLIRMALRLSKDRGKVDDYPIDLESEYGIRKMLLLKRING